ncbi:MAG TPA: D-glycerate dehydrogenase [Methylomirabilota bacterium]
MRSKVFVTQPISASALERLRGAADVTCDGDASRILPRADLLGAVRMHDYLFCLLHDIVDAEVIGANPALRMIASMAIVPANIDVAEATARGIPVTVIPAVVTEATADLTWALLLAVARRVLEGDRLVRAGRFPGSQSAYLEGRYVSGKILGIVGAGRVGQAVADRATGFGMRVVYYDPRRLSPRDEQSRRMTFSSLDQLLTDADFVSLHPSYSGATHHLIGARELALMKRSAYLVNTSRGPVVDEKALVEALARGTIAGAGLDVYEHEPAPDPALLALTNVVLTPHLGSAVGELREEMHHIVVDNILAVMEGRRPPHCVNPEVYGPART